LENILFQKKLTFLSQFTEFIEIQPYGITHLCSILFVSLLKTWRSKDDYIPFSAGSRNCIGQNFAMNEMKLTISMITTHFQMSLKHTVDIDPIITLKAKTEIKLILEPML